MKRLLPAVAAFLVALLLVSVPARAWVITSPDHEQTFTYGSEQSRVWKSWGRDRHLALVLNYTNDPYVDRDNPRQYDHFIFHFPNVKMGANGRTFYYRTADGHSLPVAVKQSDFFGIDEVKLLPNSTLVIRKPHGYLSLSIIIENQ